MPYPGPYRLPLTHLLVWYYDDGMIVECEGPGEELVVETGETAPVVVVESAGW